MALVCPSLRPLPFPEAILAPSPNFNRRRLAVDALLFHETRMATAAESLARLRDPVAEVSAHILIDEEGRIYRLVPLALRAFHAGRAFWDGVEDVNSCTIGIEMQNLGDQPYPKAQIKSLVAFCAALLGTYSIAPWRVLAHGDVAPDRRVDPGVTFPWAQLAAAGIGVCASQAAPQVVPETSFWCAQMAFYGYRPPEPSPAQAQTPKPHSPQELIFNQVAAFQRHFRPCQVDGVMDKATYGRLQFLCQYKKAGWRQ